MAKMTSEEIKNLLKNGDLTVSDIEYNDVVNTAKSVENTDDWKHVALAMYNECKRLTADVNASKQALMVPAKDRFFSDAQLNQMPEMIEYVEKNVKIRGNDVELEQEKDALKARINDRLQDIKNGKVSISPLSIDDLKAMAAQAGVNIDKELEAALDVYAQQNNIDEISSQQLEDNQTTLVQLAQELNFAADNELTASNNIINGLEIQYNKDESNADANGDKVLFREAAVNNAFLALLSSKDFSSKVEAYNQEKDENQKAKLKQEMELSFKQEVASQVETQAYELLINNALSSAKEQKKDNLTEKEANQLNEKANRQLDTLKNGGKAKVRFDSFMGLLADKSASWDEKVSFYAKKYAKSVVPGRLQARFAAWNQKMEQQHPNSWKYYKSAAVVLKKAAPGIALTGAAFLSAGTAIAIPAAAALGAYRISKGISPLLKKFREDRKENPKAGFAETVKKNKIVAGRAILSIFGGGLGVALSAGSVALDVASAARVGLGLVGAGLSTAVAVEAWRDKEASKGRKWTETAMAVVSGALAMWGITKTVHQADATELLDSKPETTPENTLPVAETDSVSVEEVSAVDEISSTEGNVDAEAVIAQDAADVKNELKAWNTEHGMNNSQSGSWWGTRTDAELLNQYDNLSEEVMDKYFPGMEKAEVMMKYNRLDAWTARVTSGGNNDLIPAWDGKTALNGHSLEETKNLIETLGKGGSVTPAEYRGLIRMGAIRHQAEHELYVLKQIIECGNTPQGLDGKLMSADEIKSVVKFMNDHITDNGDTDLSGPRTFNRIDRIDNPGCGKENEAWGHGAVPVVEPIQEPAPTPVVEPEPERIEVTTLPQTGPGPLPEFPSVQGDFTPPQIAPVVIPQIQTDDSILVMRGDYGDHFFKAGEMTDAIPQFGDKGEILNANEVFVTDGAGDQTGWFVKNPVTGKVTVYTMAPDKTLVKTDVLDPKYCGRVAGIEHHKDLFRKDHQAVYVDENGNTHRVGVNSKADGFKDLFKHLDDKGLVGEKGSQAIKQNAHNIKLGGRD